MTPADRYTENTLATTRQAIAENPGMAGNIIRKTMLVLMQTLEGLRDLAEEMDEWAPEPILAFPDASVILRKALDHVGAQALEAIEQEGEEKRHVSAICNGCGLSAAPSLEEAIMAAMSEYEPGPAILLAGEVADDEHYAIALDALNNLPQEELQALRQTAVGHVTHEVDWDDDDEEEDTD